MTSKEKDLCRYFYCYGGLTTRLEQSHADNPTHFVGKLHKSVRNVYELYSHTFIIVWCRRKGLFQVGWSYEFAKYCPIEAEIYKTMEDLVAAHFLDIV